MIRSEITNQLSVVKFRQRVLDFHHKLGLYKLKIGGVFDSNIIEVPDSDLYDSGE